MDKKRGMVVIGLIKLQRIIERKGRPWWTWQWRAFLITFMQYQKEHFQRVLDSTLAMVMMTPFSRERRHMAEEWNQGKDIRVTLKNKPEARLLCVYTPITRKQRAPCLQYVVHLTRTSGTHSQWCCHQKEETSPKKLQWNWTTINSYDEIRYRENNHMIYYLTHTPFTLYIAEANNIRIPTPQRLEQQTHRNHRLVSKRTSASTVTIRQSSTTSRNSTSTTMFIRNILNWRVHSFYDLSVHD